jgi:predicted permease
MWQWLRRKRNLERDIADEIEYHLAMLTHEHFEEKNDSSAAQAFARRKIGNQTRVTEETRSVWLNRWREEAFLDVRFAARMLIKAPLFYSLVVLILATGIATTASLFSLVDGVLLRPLPYRDPSRLIALTSYAPNPPYASNGSLSYRDYQTVAAHAKSFSQLAVTFRTGWSRVTLTGDAEPTPLQGAYVSPNLFALFGRQPILGRTFTDEENARSEHVALIGRALWAQRFGSARDVIGKTLHFGGGAWRVIGVMPDEFRVPFLDTQVWAPVLSHPGWNDRTDGEPLDQARWDVMARLKPGVSIASSQAEMTALNAHLQASSPDLHSDKWRVVPLREHFTGTVQKPLLVLLCAVALLLSIACANVANLLLARASQREKELSIRTALGAGFGRLLRQILAETLVFSGLAALLGMVATAAFVPLLTRLAPVNIPLLDSVAVDRRVLLFATAISLAIGVLLAFVTTWRLAGTAGLRKSGRTSTNTRSTVRTKKLLVVVEFAMATVLTSGALLLIRSFLAVLNVDPGFATDKILTVRIGLPAGTDPAHVTQFYNDAFTRLAHLPGVVVTGGISNLFFLDETRIHALRQVEGRAPEPTANWRPLVWAQVAGDYFTAVGIPIVEGRFFNGRDTPSSPPVVIINQTLARRYWPHEDPIGKRLKGFDPRGRHDDWLTVVGVVKDTHSGGLERAPFSQIYEVQSQRGDQLNNLVMRTTGDPATLTAAARSTLRRINQDVTIAQLSTMEQLLDSQTAGRRFQAWLIGAFSAVALSLAALGVFAIMHYSVAVRTNELGIRMALGAKPRALLWLVMWDGARLAVCGVLIGAAGALWSARAISALLFHVAPTDALNLGAAILTTLFTALLACYLPALRASRVDPLIALRAE